MALKTVVRRLPKRVSTSPRLRELMRYDVAVDSTDPQMAVPRINIPNLRSVGGGSARAIDSNQPAIDNVSPEQKRAWLLAEIDFMASVSEVSPEAARETIAREVERDLADVDVERLFAAVAGRRKAVLGQLSARGDDERAKYYRFAMESGAIAPVHVLLGLPEPHAFVASEEDPALCKASGCGLYEDETLVHGGP